jgi:hypothetical protein
MRTIEQFIEAMKEDVIFAEKIPDTDQIDPEESKKDIKIRIVPAELTDDMLDYPIVLLLPYEVKDGKITFSEPIIHPTESEFGDNSFLTKEEYEQLIHCVIDD